MSTLTSTTALASFAIASVVCFAGFALCRRRVGGKYLDQTISRRRAQTLVDSLTDEQAKQHIYVTCMLDTVFPLCYGLTLAGAALRFSHLNGLWPVLPAVAAVCFDYCENSTHIIALTKRRVPPAKPLLSLLKWFFFIIALLLPAISG